MPSVPSSAVSFAKTQFRPPRCGGGVLTTIGVTLVIFIGQSSVDQGEVTAQELEGEVDLLAGDLGMQAGVGVDSLVVT